MNNMGLLFAIASAASIMPASEAATLEALWEFDEDANCVNDSTYDGNPYGTVDLVPGVLGQAAYFNGGTAQGTYTEAVDHIDTRWMLSSYFTDGFSVMGWLNPEGVGLGGRIISLDESCCTMQAFGFGVGVNADGQLTTLIRDTTGGRVIGRSAAWTLPDHQWSHFALTWDGGSSSAIRMFLNGEEMPVALAPLGQFTGLNGTVPLPLRIGSAHADSLNTVYGFAGAVDHLSLWKGPLTPEDVQADFDAATDPVTAIAGLALVVLDLNLPQGIENSLNAKLNSALKVLNDPNTGNDVAAINSLQAFINAVEAQSGKKITAKDATTLIDAANGIVAKLLSRLAVPRPSSTGKIGVLEGQWVLACAPGFDATSVARYKPLHQH